MGRSPCCEKVGLKRGPWTSAEDRRLIHYIQTHGEGGWRALPKAAGLLRCGKSCRLRWFNYLRPDLKRGNISEEEEKLIIKLHSLLGNRWALIASRLPGRTDNEIKNHWNAHIKKRLRAIGIDPETHRPMNIMSSKLDEPATSEMAGVNNFSCMQLMGDMKRGGSYNKPSMQQAGAGSMRMKMIDNCMQTCDESMQSVTKRELGWKGVACCMELGLEREDYGMQLGMKEGDYGIQLVGIKAGGADYCMQLAESIRRDESSLIKPNNTVEVRYSDSRELVIGQELESLMVVERQRGSMVHYKKANTMKCNDYNDASEVPISKLATLNSNEKPYTAMPGFAKGSPHVYIPMPNIITTNDNISTLQDSPPLNPGTPLVPQENFFVPSRTSSDIGGDAKADQGDCPTKFCDNHSQTQCYNYSNSHAHEGAYHDNCNNFDIQSVLMSLNIDQEDATNTWNALEEGDFANWHQGGMQVHANNMDHENLVPTLGSPLAGDSTLLWGTFEDNMLVCTRPSSPPWLDFLCS